MSREKLVLVALFASLDSGAPVSPSRNRSLSLDRKAVERQVRRLEIECANEIAFPRPTQMRGQREDQIEGNVVDATASQSLNCSADLRSIVGPVHPFEGSVIETLRAE